MDTEPDVVAGADSIPSGRLMVSTRKLLQAFEEHRRNRLGVAEGGGAAAAVARAEGRGNIVRFCGDKAPLLMPISAALQAEAEAALRLLIPESSDLVHRHDGMQWTAVVSGSTESVFYFDQVSEFVGSALALAARAVYEDQVFAAGPKGAGTSRVPSFGVPFVLLQVVRPSARDMAKRLSSVLQTPEDLARHPIVCALRVFPV